MANLHSKIKRVMEDLPPLEDENLEEESQDSQEDSPREDSESEEDSEDEVRRSAAAQLFESDGSSEDSEFFGFSRIDP